MQPMGVEVGDIWAVHGVHNMKIRPTGTMQLIHYCEGKVITRSHSNGGSRIRADVLVTVGSSVEGDQIIGVPVFSHRQGKRPS